MVRRAERALFAIAPTMSGSGAEWLIIEARLAMQYIEPGNN